VSPTGRGCSGLVEGLGLNPPPTLAAEKFRHAGNELFVGNEKPPHSTDAE
jgi:hypothetical protein